MALRRMLGCLRLAALAAVALTGCKDGSGDSKDAGAENTAKPQAGVAQLEKRCDRLGKVCGEKFKHQEKIIEDCIEAAKSQTEKGCWDKVGALYDCYESEICGKFENEKVWAIDDLRVLSERHTRCLAQRTASDACMGSAK